MEAIFLFINSDFRYNIDKVLEKVLPGRFSFLVQYQPNRSSNRRPPQSMRSVLQEFNADQFNFTKVNKEKEVVAVLRHSREGPADVIIINVSPIDLGHCLLVPQLESCLPQVVQMVIIFIHTECPKKRLFTIPASFKGLK